MDNFTSNELFLVSVGVCWLREFVHWSYFTAKRFPATEINHAKNDLLALDTSNSRTN